MLKKLFIRFSILFLLLAIFSLFILYNYRQAQRGLDEYRPAEVSLTLDSYPQTISLSQSLEIDWTISAPAGMTTPFTTIYYAAESSPSALTVKDSPQAVGYANHLTDYTQGEFVLPDSFTVCIFPLVDNFPTSLFFRAYAKVGGSHYWTNEYQLTITP